MANSATPTPSSIAWNFGQSYCGLGYRYWLDPYSLLVDRGFRLAQH